MRWLPLALFALLCGCKQAPPPDAGAVPTGPSSHARVQNRTAAPASVLVTFGSGSEVSGWPFCVDGGAGACSFSLDAWKDQELPSSGKRLVATISFGGGSSGAVDLGDPSATQDSAGATLPEADLEVVISGDKTLSLSNGCTACKASFAHGAFVTIAHVK